MSDVFEEVEESLRQDKVSLWWKRYGIFVWAIGLSIIGAVAWREYALYQAGEETEARVEAFEAARTELLDGDYEAAQAGFADLVQADAEISPVAAQYLARSYYEGNGDLDGAIAVLQTAGEEEGPLERLSLLKSVYLRADSFTLPELEAELGEMHKESTALGALALELVAAKALKEGDITRAREEFSYLRFAPGAPQGVVQRAEVALSVIPAGPADESVEPEIIEPDEAEDTIEAPAETEQGETE